MRVEEIFYIRFGLAGSKRSRNQVGFWGSNIGKESRGRRRRIDKFSHLEPTRKLENNSDKCVFKFSFSSSLSLSREQPEHSFSFHSRAACSSD